MAKTKQPKRRVLTTPESDREARVAARLKLDRQIQESDNRRKLIAGLSPQAAAFARREFAKLGLF